MTLRACVQLQHRLSGLLILKAASVLLCVMTSTHVGLAANLKIPFPYAAYGPAKTTRIVPFNFTVSVVSVGKEKQVRVGNIAADFEPVAARAFATALAADKKSPVFRLLWHTNGFRSEYDNIVLYDRRRHRLKYLTSGYYGDESMQTTEYYWCVFNRVTDKMIFKNAAPNSPSSGFDRDLVHSGAKMQVGDRVTNMVWRYGYPSRKTHWHYPPLASRHHSHHV